MRTRRKVTLTANQIDEARMSAQSERVHKGLEINRRYRKLLCEVVRRDVPYFTEQQIHDAVCAMLLTKAIPECINLRALEREVITGEQAGIVCRETT